MKKCVEYEMEGFRPRDRPKRNWGVVQKDCQACKFISEDAIDHSKKLLRDGQ